LIGSSIPASVLDQDEPSSLLATSWPAVNDFRAVHAALREIVPWSASKRLMSKYGGRLEFSGHDE